MLDFDLRVRVQKYNEATGTREDVVIDESFVDDIQKQLEFAVERTPYILLPKEKFDYDVLVYNIEGISRVGADN